MTLIILSQVIHNFAFGSYKIELTFTLKINEFYRLQKIENQISLIKTFEYISNTFR